MNPIFFFEFSHSLEIKIIVFYIHLANTQARELYPLKPTTLNFLLSPQTLTT